MDELPVPNGSWQARYDANQRRYNAVLLFGVAFSAFSIIVVRYEVDDSLSVVAKSSVSVGCG